MSIEKALASLLEAEVEKRVALVQEAADKVITEFRAMALRIAAGESPVAPSLPYPEGARGPSAATPGDPGAIPDTIAPPPPDTVSPPLPDAAQEIINGMAGRTKFDNDAISANMSVR